MNENYGHQQPEHRSGKEEQTPKRPAPESVSLLATNLDGQPGLTTYTDTNAPGPGPYFYRAGTEPE